MTVVLYHADCQDGFTSAWVASLFLPPDTHFCEVKHGTPIPDCVDHAQVYLLDFSYERQVMLALRDRASDLVVIDHHASAESRVAGLQSDKCRVVFTTEYSAAILTWKFFRGDEQAPWIASYAEDRDLWRWKLPDSREVSAYLHSIERDFNNWSHHWIACSPGGSGWRDMVIQGGAILRYQQQVVNAHLRNVTRTTVLGHSVPCCNVSALHSEVGHALCAGEPFSATYYDRADGQRIWSLRSDDNGMDVQKIATSLGGGGHPRAAGFQEKL